MLTLTLLAALPASARNRLFTRAVITPVDDYGWAYARLDVQLDATADGRWTYHVVVPVAARVYFAQDSEHPIVCEVQGRGRRPLREVRNCPRDEHALYRSRWTISPGARITVLIPVASKSGRFSEGSFEEDGTRWVQQVEPLPRVMARQTQARQTPRRSCGSHLEYDYAQARTNNMMASTAAWGRSTGAFIPSPPQPSTLRSVSDCN